MCVPAMKQEWVASDTEELVFSEQNEKQKVFLKKHSAGAVVPSTTTMVSHVM